MSPAEHSAAPPPAPHHSSVPQRLVNRFTYPADHPIASLTAYYLVLAALATGLFWLFPDLMRLVSGQRLAEMLAAGEANRLAAVTPRPIEFGWQFTAYMAAAMIGCLLLMLPTSWVYMATRQKKGFNQGMVQTLLILSMAIAGVVVIVRNSLALAFSLAGIVGAVRFRNSLPDTRDTIYVFLAIGVGLAAGVEALGAAAVLSVLFNYTVLFLTRSDYGACELGKSSRPLLLTHAGTVAGARDHKGNGKRQEFNGVLVVRTRHAEETMRRLPMFLDQEVRRWALADVEVSKKRAHLSYLVRTRKGTTAEQLEDAILDVGGEDIIGVKLS